MRIKGKLNLNDNKIVSSELTDYSETINIVGNATGAKTIDLTLGNVVTATTTGSTVWTFSNPSISGKSCVFTLILTNGGSQTQTWPDSTDWAGGIAPTLTAAGVDVLTFFTIDAGTTWMGAVAIKDVR